MADTNAPTDPAALVLPDELRAAADHLEETGLEFWAGQVRNALRSLAELREQREGAEELPSSLLEKYPKGCIPDMYPFGTSQYDSGWNNAIMQVRHNIERLRLVRAHPLARPRADDMGAPMTHTTPKPPPQSPRVEVTESQRCMLECIDEHAGYEWDGWAEVELQWSSKRGVPDPLVSRAAWNCAEALRRKGLLKDDYSPVLTEAGQALLEPRP